jgi:hypothetical protein
MYLVAPKARGSPHQPHAQLVALEQNERDGKRGELFLSTRAEERNGRHKRV